jgi:uncharacterized membrane protein YvlD (DUF360 family)
MESLITALVNGIVVPVVTVLTAPIPFLASSGLLLAIFAALWLAFGIALVRDRARIDSSWHRLRSLPLPVQLIAWLLFLPVIAGLWIWRTSWPQAARLLVVAGLAGWNLLVLLPAA